MRHTGAEDKSYTHLMGALLRAKPAMVLLKNGFKPGSSLSRAKAGNCTTDCNSPDTHYFLFPLVEEFYSTRYQSGSFSLINVGSNSHAHNLMCQVCTIAVCTVTHSSACMPFFCRVRIHGALLFSLELGLQAGSPPTKGVTKQAGHPPSCAKP